MKKRIFFISRHPDIDHICSYIYFTNNKSYRNIIIPRDWDSQTNHYLIKEIRKKGIAEIINRLDIKNYHLKVLFLCFISKKKVLAIFRRLISLKISLIIENYVFDILRNNLNTRLFEIAKDCELYLDHRNCNRGSDYILDVFKESCEKIISLPHTLLYVENPTKYMKAALAFKKCFANEIYFYHNFHKDQLLKYIPEKVETKKIKPFRYFKEWFHFRKKAYERNTFNIKNLLILNRFTNKETVVFLDTPFFGNEKLAFKRKSLLNLIQSKYRLIIVPHPRSNIITTSFKAEIWTGEIACLISKYKKFVGIFTTLSIDLAQAHRLYITCHHLRDESYRNNYKLKDEEIGATKLAYSNESVLDFLNSKADIKAQNEFIKILGLDSIKI